MCVCVTMGGWGDAVTGNAAHAQVQGAPEKQAVELCKCREARENGVVPYEHGESWDRGCTLCEFREARKTY